MNAQVQKLEALLARVQENRKKPRVAVAAPVAAAPAVAPAVRPAPAAPRPQPVVAKTDTAVTAPPPASPAIETDVAVTAPPPAAPVAAEPVDAPPVVASGPVAVTEGVLNTPRPRTFAGLVERSLSLRVRG